MKKCPHGKRYYKRVGESAVEESAVEESAMEESAMEESAIEESNKKRLIKQFGNKPWPKN